MTAVAPDLPRVSLPALYFATPACSMGMMGFVAAAGPLGEALGLSAADMGIAAAAGDGASAEDHDETQQHSGAE